MSSVHDVHHLDVLYRCQMKVIPAWFCGILKNAADKRAILPDCRSYIMIAKGPFVERANIDNEVLLTHWGQDKMAAISQAIFSDAFLWMESFIFWL